jgi:hypothetical protein
MNQECQFEASEPSSRRELDHRGFSIYTLPTMHQEIVSSIKTIRDIIETQSGKPIASNGLVSVVSPSVRVLYPNIWRNLNGLLRAAGSLGVRPVASGIPEFAARCAEAVRSRGPGIHVLSACPAAVDFLKAEFPELTGSVLDVASPMAISSETSLALAGIPDGTAIAISPCSMKKREETRVKIDMRVVAAARFLRSLKEAGIDVSKYPASEFDPAPRCPDASGCEILRIVEDALNEKGIGQIKPLKLVGRSMARPILTGLLGENGPKPFESVVIELSFCDDGCLREPVI